MNTANLRAVNRKLTDLLSARRLNPENYAVGIQSLANELATQGSDEQKAVGREAIQVLGNVRDTSNVGAVWDRAESATGVIARYLRAQGVRTGGKTRRGRKVRRSRKSRR